MSASFDPYFKWFGIPPDEQPPHHYRLLGISLFEDDCDVIQAAVDRQVIHLKMLRTGEHAPDAKQILNEVLKAEQCLLDKRKRTAYDATLKTHLHLDQPRSQNRGSQKGDAGKGPKPRAVMPARPGNATEQSSQSESPLPAAEVVAPFVSMGGKPASSVATQYKRRRRKNKSVWVLSATFAAAAAGLIVAGVVVLDRHRPRARPTSPPGGATVVADDSDEWLPGVTRSRHHPNATDHLKDPKPVQPRTEMVRDNDDGKLAVAGELPGKKASTSSDPQHQPPSLQDRRKAFIENMDTNHDAIVTRTEYSAGVKKRFNELDKNGDGVLDKKEWPHGQRATPEADYVDLLDQIFILLDQNQDECLTLEERESD